MGQWLDSQGSGRYDTLAIETRGFKGPRIIDNTGIPLHFDNQAVIRERTNLAAARLHAALDGDPQLPPRRQGGIDRISLPREQYLRDPAR
jgi:hypothetical protein